MINYLANNKMQTETDNYFMNNIAEEEFGQLHAIHNNMNHIAAVRRKLEQQASKPSLKICIECGDDIPEARRLAVPGVRYCVYCQERHD